MEKGRIDEKAKSSFFESAFSDALAIYMLSLTLDFNYTDLRSASIRCSPRPRWLSVYATSRRCFLPTPATSFKSPIATNSRKR